MRPTTPWLVRLEELKTVADRLSVKVLVKPQESMWDSRLVFEHRHRGADGSGERPGRTCRIRQESRRRRSPPPSRRTATPITGRLTPTATDTLSADVLVGTGDARAVQARSRRGYRSIGRLGRQRQTGR